jgi:hypothetical protein
LLNDNNHSAGKTLFGATIPDYVIPDTVSSHLVLRIGARYQTEPFVPLVSTAGIGMLLVSLTTKAALLSIPDAPKIDNFFYIKGSVELGFYFTKDSGLMSQTTANYEVDATRDEKKYRRRSRIIGSRVAYAIYLERKADKIEILKFSPHNSVD